VHWDNEAKASLQSIVAYIRQDSPAAAQKVKQALLRLAALRISIGLLHLEYGYF
jgi:plasmid stabilization system protein ParE